MKSIKCTQCGLVNFASAPHCKKCGAQLSQQVTGAAANEKGKAISIISSGGMPDGVKGGMVFAIACVVCALTIFWIKPYLPEGTYLVLCFIPFAFVGIVVAILAVNLINVVYKNLNPKG